MTISKLKTGLTDTISVLRDRNYAPFGRPLLLLIVAVSLAWLLHKGTSTQIAEMKKKSEAQAAELENREEYLRNKSKYMRLAEVLPPNTEKEVWHKLQLVSIREQLGLTERELSGGNEVRNTEGVFTISTIPIKAELTFDQLGRVLETIENYPSFLRVSDLKVSRKQGELKETSEKLSVSFNTNTVFVQDKDFPDLKGGKQ